MASIFTKIIEGEIPGRFVWRDDRVVAFLTVAPTAPGHTLVVPIDEVDHWIDLDPDLAVHLMRVSQIIGRTLDTTFESSKIGVLIVGEEVPHTHVHLIPFTRLDQLDLSHADHGADGSVLDGWAEQIREGLRRDGHENFVAGP